MDTSYQIIESLINRCERDKKDLFRLELQRLVLVAQKEQMLLDRDMFMTITSDTEEITVPKNLKGIVETFIKSLEGWEK